MSEQHGRTEDGTGAPEEDSSGTTAQHRAHDLLRDEERAHQRAGAVAEEERVPAADPDAQAEVILAESDERTQDPAGTRATYHQTSGEDDIDTPVSDTTRLNS